MAASHCGTSGGCGTLFKITPTGTLTTVHTFCINNQCVDGANPIGGLVQAADGDFYGTTSYGGTPGIAPHNGWGTVFKMTTSGALTTVYSFCATGVCSDGKGPAAALVQATDGNFYGTTTEGGAKNIGTIFEITPGGVFSTLYSFCTQLPCGNTPYAGLIQATNGDLYGTTSSGGPYCTGSSGCGTLFKLSVGLGPL